MSRHHYDHILANEDFHTLVKEKSKLGWALALLMLIVYYSFILVIAFAPEWLGTPLSSSSSVTWGLPIGIGIILFTFVITGVYVQKANNQFDAAMDAVVTSSNTHVENRATSNQSEATAAESPND